MAFDGFFLHCIKNEIAAFAIGAKVDKIFLPTHYELVLCLRTRTEQKKLFISVAGNSPRINFTSYSPENPAKPPMLCMLLRKQLTGAIITDIRQAGFDRVLFIDFNASDDIGERVKRTLVVEIMAQYSNCILLDENGVVIDALRRVDASKSSVRVVLPKCPYVMPPRQDKLPIDGYSPAQLAERIFSAADERLSKAILNVLSGASPLVCRELAYRVSLADPPVSELSDEQKDRFVYELEILKDILLNGKITPCYLVDTEGNYREFSFLPLTLYSNAASLIKTDTLSQLPDIFYVERERQARARSKADDLFRLVSSLTERTSRKLNNQRGELAEGEKTEYKRVYAELINANLYSLGKGSAFYEVNDYYNDYQPVRIPVDPALSPAQNAQKYFKEYRKAQTAKRVLAEQIEIGVRDLEYLQSVQDELSRAVSERELSAIRAELGESGYIKSKTGTLNKKNAPLAPLEFEAPDGFKVIVGRNNIQNDTISFKTARKTDMWFHAKNAPGSHTVLLLDGGQPTRNAMEFAAETAAYFSSVRERGMAEVDYTLIKNLKKPPAAKPGYVIYHIYNTAYVKAVDPLKNNRLKEDGND